MKTDVFLEPSRKKTGSGREQRRVQLVTWGLKALVNDLRMKGQIERYYFITDALSPPR